MMDGIINEPDFDLSPTPLQLECERLRSELTSKEQQLATSQAEILGLRDVLKLVLDQAIVGRTFPATASRTAWFNAVPIALSAPPGDQSALREVIAQVLDERGQAQRFGNADYGADPYYLLIGNAAQLRSGKWAPEVLR